jgi:hypothetical protein
MELGVQIQLQACNYVGHETVRSSVVQHRAVAHWLHPAILNLHETSRGDTMRL